MLSMFPFLFDLFSFLFFSFLCLSPLYHFCATFSSLSFFLSFFLSFSFIRNKKRRELTANDSENSQGDNMIIVQFLNNSTCVEIIFIKLYSLKNVSSILISLHGVLFQVYSGLNFVFECLFAFAVCTLLQCSIPSPILCEVRTKFVAIQSLANFRPFPALDSAERNMNPIWAIRALISISISAFVPVLMPCFLPCA
jgi:hypothetical protein